MLSTFFFEEIMDSAETYIATLRTRLHTLKDRWGSHLDFWDFIAVYAGLASGRSAYNFATGHENNPRLSTVRGIERALIAAEEALRKRSTER